MIQLIVGLLLLVVLIYVFIVLPMSMAKARNRNRFGWLLVSLVFSPLVAIVALLVLGRAAPSSGI
jgi:hypothetical protein